VPIRRSVSISLSPELQAVAEGLLATGRYGNISDVMRTALRLLEERELAFQAHKDAVTTNGQAADIKRTTKAKTDVV